jgi:hypothetical protein
MKRRVLGVAAVVACMAGVPAGFAIGQAITDDPKAPKGPHKTAKECPGANAFFKAHGFEYEYFVPNCPPKEELDLIKPDLKQDPVFIKICEEEAARNELSEGCTALLERQAEMKAIKREARQ